MEHSGALYVRFFRYVVVVIAVAAVVSERGGVVHCISQEGQHRHQTTPWTADCDVVRGPALRRGNGVLISVTKDSPSDSILQAWRPSMYRGAVGDGTLVQDRFLFTNYHRLVRAGVTDIQMILSNAWSKSPNSWPCDYGNCSDWVALLAEVAAIVEGRSGEGESAGVPYSNVTFDVWNEPDGVFWLATYDQYLTAFATAVPVLRKLAPSALVMGPSFFTYERDKMASWLSYMAAQDALPDVLSWHELLVPTGQHIDATVAEVRAMLTPYPQVRAISINEIIPFPDPIDQGFPQTAPGTLISFLAAAERTMIKSMAHSCWSTQCNGGGGSNGMGAIDDDCWSDTMDGTVCGGGSALRSTYYVYVAYAKIEGNILFTSPNGFVDGVAGVDADARAVRVLLGNSDPLGVPPVGPVQVEVLHIPMEWTSLNVVGSWLPFSGYNASAGWQVVMQETVQNIEGRYVWEVDTQYLDMFGAVFLVVEAQ